VALDPAQADVFLCGNPDMVNAVKALLEAKDSRPTSRETGTIHVEEYW